MWRKRRRWTGLNSEILVVPKLFVKHKVQFDKSSNLGLQLKICRQQGSYDNILFALREPIELTDFTNHDWEGLLPYLISVKTFPIPEGNIWSENDHIALRNFFVLIHSASPPSTGGSRVPTNTDDTYGTKISRTEGSLSGSKILSLTDSSRKALILLIGLVHLSPTQNILMVLPPQKFPCLLSQRYLVMGE